MKRLNLQRLALSRDPDLPFPGDECIECGGRIEIYRTKQEREIHVTIRYLRCEKCRVKPDENKWVTPAD